MPNWVSNTMTVTGKSADLQKFVEQAGKPTPQDYKQAIGEAEPNGNSDKFSFWHFITPTELDYYFGEVKDEKPEGYEEWDREQQMAHDLKFTGKGWYDWNISNWGTKWDANSANIFDDFDPLDTNPSFGVVFETAWSIPTPVFQAMVEQHPDRVFDFESEEEQGWGAKYYGEAGELSLTQEWDIPQSHADYYNQGKDCYCGSGDYDEESWFDDCPRPDKAYYVVVTRTYKVTTHSAENAWELAQDNDPNEQMELLEDETMLFVNDENGERLFPVLDDTPKVKVCGHKFVPLHKGASEQTGWSCVFCNEERPLDPDPREE